MEDNVYGHYMEKTEWNILILNIHLDSLGQLHKHAKFHIQII